MVDCKVFVNPPTVKYEYACSLAMRALKSDDFKKFITETKFTQLDDPKIQGEQLIAEYFSDRYEAIEWRFIDRPWYKWRSSVIGWYDDGVIFTYRQRADQMDKAELAGHFAHELMHHYGFGHSFKPSKERDASLPYRVGYWVEQVVRANLKG